MRLEEQVCSMEQAKKLVDLGLQLSTCYYWLEQGNVGMETQTLLSESDITSIADAHFYPAPTVAELGILLPTEITDEDEDYYLQGSIGDRRGEFFYIWFQSALDNIEWELFPAIEKDTEAEARAEALIWLLENGMVKPENLRL